MKKIAVSIVLAFVCVAMYAQDSARDSVTSLFDDMKIPLVERRFVANTNFQDNWFISLYGGVTSNWGSDVSHASFWRVMGPAAAIAVGKDLTPVSTFRMQINYVRNTGVTDDQFGTVTQSDGSIVDYSWMNHERYKWNSMALNFEYMLNFTNLIWGFKENRKFHFQGIIGVGGSVSRGYTTSRFAEAQGIDNSHAQQLANLDKYDTRQHSLINLRAGVAGTFMIARHWNLHMEIVGNLLDNSYDSNPTTKNTWDGHNDFMIGLSYRFNNKGGQAPGFYYPRHDMSEYIRRMSTINDLRDKTKKRRDELAEMTDTIDVNAQVMYTLIAFDTDDAAIDRLQQTNIYTAAYVWAKSPRSLIYIVNSTAADDKLFRKRAEAIRDVLIERYEIPASRIWIIPNERDIQPIGDYIEMIVND